MRPLTAALLLAAAPAAAALRADEAAEVDGRPIALSDYKKEAAAAVAVWNRENPGVPPSPAGARRLRASALDDLITRELLDEQAEREGLTVSDAVFDAAVGELKARFEKDRESGRVPAKIETFDEWLALQNLGAGGLRAELTPRILAREVVEKGVKAKLSPPSDRELRDAFARITAFLAPNGKSALAGLDEGEAAAFRGEARKILAATGERVRVRRILVRLAPKADAEERAAALRKARALKARLDAGGDFAALAKAESADEKSAARGGDVGYLLPSGAPTEFEKAAFALRVGRASAPVETEDGDDILLATEKRAQTTPRFESFKDDLSKILAGLAFDRGFAAYVKGLRDKAVVERRPDAAGD